jgi:hypothetical protein
MAVTLTPRSVILIVSTAVAAGWLGASLTQPPPPAQAPARSIAVKRGGDARPVPRAEALREALAQQPPLPSRGRNPFVYGARTAPVIRDHQQHGDEGVMPAAPLVPVAPPAPVFKLSGIASNTENGVAVLTGIVIDNGSMVFVKTGDKLSNGYSVVRIDDTSVTIVDASGVTQTLRLP